MSRFSVLVFFAAVFGIAAMASSAVAQIIASAQPEAAAVSVMSSVQRI